MSQLPGAAAATLNDAKIQRYLLDSAHSAEAAAKARFFTAFGFTLGNWDKLKQALLDHPVTNPVIARVSTPFGEKFVVSCTLTTPDGRNPCILSVWIVERPDPRPRFVTAYPNP